VSDRSAQRTLPGLLAASKPYPCVSFQSVVTNLCNDSSCHRSAAGRPSRRPPIPRSRTPHEHGRDGTRALLANVSRAPRRLCCAPCPNPSAFPAKVPPTASSTTPQTAIRQRRASHSYPARPHAIPIGLTVAVPGPRFSSIRLIRRAGPIGLSKLFSPGLTNPMGKLSVGPARRIKRSPFPHFSVSPDFGVPPLQEIRPH